MIVKVSLHGDVHRYRRGRSDPFDQELPEGATVQQLADAVGIDPAMTLTFGVNGEMAGRDHSLHEGDAVMILTPMEGGAPMQSTTARHHGTRLMRLRAPMEGGS